MKTIALMAGSALAGACLGMVFQADLGTDATAVSEPSSDGVEQAAGDRIAADDGTVPAVVSGQVEIQTFAVLPAEKQRETVLKWAARPAHFRTSGDELAMVRAVKALGYEQIVGLLETMASAKGEKGDSLDFVRVSLKERLAALDPKLALELGRQKNDAQLRSAAVLALVTKNAGEGLRALAQLPEAERSGVWALAKGLDKPGGSLADLAALVKEAPEVMKVQDLQLGVESCAGSIAARRMAADPEGGLAEWRQIAAALRAARARADSGSGAKSGAEPQQIHLTMGMMLELRELSPEAARKAFDSLSETDKSRFLISTEAMARLKELGADAAIRFAETQASEDSVKEAARGIWRGLAQQERSAALQWLEALPPGSFRQGVMDAVKWEASLRNRSFGSPSGYLHAGAELLSRATQLDYYEAVISPNSRASLEVSAPSELISSLPISESDKQELRRRLAPVKAK
jgi:hypothetical protein